MTMNFPLAMVRALTWSMIIASMFFAQALQSVQHFSITLPSDSKKIHDHRYQSSKTYEETVKMLQTTSASKLTKREEIILPHVRATFFESLLKGSSLWGVNVYVTEQTGITQIFFLTEPIAPLSDNLIQEND